MKLAVAYKDGNVFNHFGRSEYFAIYDIELNNIISMELKSTEGKGHSELVGFLKELNVDILFVGGIGTNAINLLKEKGIDVYTGVTGDVQKNVIDFLNGNLVYDPNMVHECKHNH